jgi:hypothetical protein
MTATDLFQSVGLYRSPISQFLLIQVVLDELLKAPFTLDAPVSYPFIRVTRWRGTDND